AQERLDLRREIKVAAVLVEKQRLLAEAVPREKQAFPARVPDGEREHAAQASHDPAPPLLIRSQQHFGIGVERETVSEPHQLAAHLAEFVDLCVESEREL